jgi:hypothetical protein
VKLEDPVVDGDLVRLDQVPDTGEELQHHLDRRAVV